MDAVLTRCARAHLRRPYEARAEELGKEIGYASAVTEMDRQLSLVRPALAHLVRGVAPIPPYKSSLEAM